MHASAFMRWAEIDDDDDDEEPSEIVSSDDEDKDQNDSTIVFPADILDYNTTAIVRGSVFLDDKE